MNGKTIRIMMLAGLAVLWGTLTAQAQPCGPVTPPCNVVTKKVWVTEYKMEAYEATRTVMKIEWKEEKYTAYKCEVVPEVHTRPVTFVRTVPVTKEVEVMRYECVPVVEEQTVTRFECVPVVEERPVTRYECVPVVEEKTVTRYECVPVVEERPVTRYETHMVPVEKTVSRCVDAGGHYECREVPCDGGSEGRHGLLSGLFRRRHHHCGCEETCAPAMTTVSVYVPNMVTVQEKVKVMQCVTKPVTETVKVTTFKMVAKPETMKVTTYKTVAKPETVKVTVLKTIAKPEKVKVTTFKTVTKPEKVKVTTYECKTETSEEKFTVYSQKTTPYEATRKVAVPTPVTEKYTAYRCVPVQVEKEVSCVVPMPTCDYGCEAGCTHGLGHRRHKLFHRGCS